MTFFAKTEAGGSGVERAASAATRRRRVRRQVRSFRGRWQLTNPRWCCSATRGGRGARSPRRDPRVLPDHPLTKDVDSWDIQRAVAFADRARRFPDPLPEGGARVLRLVDVRTALVDPPAGWSQISIASAGSRFEALVAAGCSRPPSPGGARDGRQARTGDQGGLLAAFDAGLPFVTAGQRRVGAQVDLDLAQPRR